MMCQLRPTGRSGFTLIELLVVVSIIALIVSILMPALGNARESAKRVVCNAHLHDLGIAVLSYAVDNRDHFPDKLTLGGWGFRAEPGYRDPLDQNGLPETFGLAAVLGNGGYTDPVSDLWVCPGQKPIVLPSRTFDMQELGNTYAFNIATKLEKTPLTQLQGNLLYKYMLVWDNFTMINYAPGFMCSGGGVGYSIPSDARRVPHQYGSGKKKTTAYNALYPDGHTMPHFETLD